MRKYWILLLSSFVFLGACKHPRIKEHKDWSQFFEEQGIAPDKACFMIRDNNHESIHYYNLDRCNTRYSPASTFKILNALVGLETAVIPDDQYVLVWDGISSSRPECNKNIDLREAFKLSCVPYFQKLALRVGRETMQHYLDTAHYGNQKMGDSLTTFWLDNSLQINADEQLGLVKKLYFNELPFSERSQRIVRSMMLQEDTPERKLYYKTGWSEQGEIAVIWIVGYLERIVQTKEHKNSMNKVNERLYPFFFAMNFEISSKDASKDWKKVRVDIVNKILDDYMPKLK